MSRMKRSIRSLYPNHQHDRMDMAAQTLQYYQRICNRPPVDVDYCRVVTHSLPLPTSSSTLLYPLPLFVYISSSQSTSRRRQQVQDRRFAVIIQANLLVQALNSLFFDLHSDYLSDVTFLPSSPSFAQHRLLLNVYNLSSSFIDLCRSRASARCGLLLDATTSLLVTDSPFITLLPQQFIRRVRLPASDVTNYSTLPHIATPMIYGPSPSIVPLNAARASLPDTLHSIPILPLLSPSDRQLYSAPSDNIILSPSQHAALLIQMELDGEILPSEPFTHSQPIEYIKLMQRMLAVRMVTYSVTKPKCVNGIFAVFKDTDSDRVIIDARRSNTWFTVPPKVKLPSPAHLIMLQVPPDECLASAKMDMRDYYHKMELPEWMYEYFGLPPLTAGDLDIPEIDPAQIIYPCCRTLPMGWSHSVYIAQSVHERMLYKDSDETGTVPWTAPLSNHDSVLCLQRPRLTRIVHAIYIDDLLLLAPRSLFLELQQKYQRCLDTYNYYHFAVKSSKCILPTSDQVIAIGVMIDGWKSMISISPERHEKVITATLHLLYKDIISGHDLSRVLGLWAWNLLLRRPTFSVLKHSYTFIARYKKTPIQPSPIVRTELIALIGLAPTLQTCLKSPWFPSVIASDASELAAGVVATTMTDELLDLLWPTTISNQLTTLPQFSLTQVVPTDWSTVISFPWRHAGEHINALELRAALLAIRRTITSPHSVNTRLLLVLDSAVTYYIMRKGRTSSSPLLSILRRLAAFVLASGLHVIPVWVQSAANPADRPSRLFYYDEFRTN